MEGPHTRGQLRSPPLSVEGLWTTVFSDENGPHTTGGVILLQKGHLHGGDNNYHYEGTYRVDGDRIELTLSATHFHGGRSHIVGDRDAFTLHLSGPVGEREMALAGHLDDDPDVSVTATLRRQAELPEGAATV